MREITTDTVKIGSDTALPSVALAADVAAEIDVLWQYLVALAAAGGA